MPIALRDIKGLLIDRNKCPIHGLSKPNAKIGGCNCYEIKIENATLDLQSQFKIGLNREKLANVIWNIRPEKFMSIHATKQELLFISDAIIASEHELLEVKQ